MKCLLLLLCFTTALTAQPCDPDSINWHDPEHVSQYICSTYPDIADEILQTVQYESGFRPFVKNPKSSAYGLMQVTKACAEGLGHSYKLIVECPSENLEAGVMYLKMCLKKAKGSYQKAMLYYEFGLWYEKQSNP